ncbi:MAG TPA: hypothetical protein VGX46_17665 [Vicinamibacterales bacterium]|jgi:hypothetical protein|nr:hypothetical protein [Vicinamibacterales bacterium]
MTTVLKVNGDGSGTIDHQLLLTRAALAQIRQFAALAGGRGQRLDLISEDQARAMAGNLGPGVSYVSSTPIDSADGQGRATTYAFTDISQIRISQQPQPPAGLTVGVQGLPKDTGSITCSMTRSEDGNVVLHINLPELSLPPAINDSTSGGTPIAQQMAMIRSLLADARVLIAVEPAGRLVRTSSPYVDGQRVTLVDANLDQLLGNEALLARLQASKSADDLKAALKDVPDLKLTLDREVTIEFTPAK